MPAEITELRLAPAVNRVARFRKTKGDSKILNGGNCRAPHEEEYHDQENREWTSDDGCLAALPVCEQRHGLRRIEIPGPQRRMARYRQQMANQSAVDAGIPGRVGGQQARSLDRWIAHPDMPA